MMLLLLLPVLCACGATITATAADDVVGTAPVAATQPRSIQNDMVWALVLSVQAGKTELVKSVLPRLVRYDRLKSRNRWTQPHLSKVPD
jgi:hypothetical protein